MVEKISLNGEWYFRQYCGRHNPAELVYDGWNPAQVPGTVHLDLLRLGIIPDPFYRLNETEVAWVAGCDWFYRRKFKLSDNFCAGSPAELIFHGLDTYAEIVLNGHPLGKSENMFTTWRQRVEEYLKPGDNLLEVCFNSPTKKTIEIAADERLPFKNGGGIPERGYARKSLYSFGWDWGPRLATSGIWKDVELVFPCEATLSDVHFRSRVERDTAHITVEASGAAYKPGCYAVRATLAGHGYTKTMQEEIINSAESAFSANTEFTIDNPKLWWPAGYGEPSLYTLHVELLDGERVLDAKEMRVGIRTVELMQEPDEIGEKFYFRVNGVPVFAKGANWVPADSFLPRVDAAKYEKLVDMAVEANMNMLRVWGGGIYEDDAFYNACDAKGIMVWQDFMFACYEVPELEWYHKLVAEEAKENIVRLRNHPSLVLWCGNNENDWGFCDHWWGENKDIYYGKTIYTDLLPKICAELDPSRPYWQSSPCGGEHPNCRTHGDRHSWDVWSSWQDYPDYRQDHGRFISEFGFQALPTMHAIRTFAEEDDLSPKSEVIRLHNKMIEGVERLEKYLSARFAPHTSFEEYVEQTQINQGEALRCGIEHWRGHKFDISGALIWQMNDCWPVSSWALVDYENRRKAAYYFVKRAFAPVMLSVWPGEEEMEICLVNDTLSAVGGTLQALLVDTGGETIWQHEEPLSAEANGCGKVLIPASSLPEEARDGALILARVYNESGTVTGTRALFRPIKDLIIPDAEVKITSVEARKDGGLTVTISAESLACYVHLESADGELSLSDNWFHMLPGEGRRIIVRPCGTCITPDSIKVECFSGLARPVEVPGLEGSPVPA